MRPGFPFPHISQFVEIENDARVSLVAFLNRCIAEEDAEDIGLRVIGYFHGCLQYSLMLLLPCTVLT
jgi:hypothetical protein